MHRVIAPYLDRCAELGQVLDEVVDEAVVVVDDQDSGHYWFTVTRLIGNFGSSHGKTMNSSSALIAATISSVWSTFQVTAPGRWRQIHTYIRASLRLVPSVADHPSARRCAPACRAGSSAGWR